MGQFGYRGGPDFGNTGIIAHLAGLPGERYRNPATAGLITVTASSLMPDSSPPSAILGNEVVLERLKGRLKQGAVGTQAIKRR